jgi:hypothetical protein
MSANSNISPSTTSPSTTTTNLEPIDLLADFRKILGLFDRENQIYKAQIDILKDTLSTLQTNEDNMISKMSQELQELRQVINNLGGEMSNSITTPAATAAEAPRQLTDYLCQICLDAPRDCLLEPCMHFCLCARCVNQLPESKCPICRRPIEFYQNVFIS